jgi:hypothetical protein
MTIDDGGARTALRKSSSAASRSDSARCGVCVSADNERNANDEGIRVGSLLLFVCLFETKMDEGSIDYEPRHERAPFERNNTCVKHNQQKQSKTIVAHRFERIRHGDIATNNSKRKENMFVLCHAPRHGTTSIGFDTSTRARRAPQ